MVSWGAETRLSRCSRPMCSSDLMALRSSGIAGSSQPVGGVAGQAGGQLHGAHAGVVDVLSSIIDTSRSGRCQWRTRPAGAPWPRS